MQFIWAQHDTKKRLVCGEGGKITERRSQRRNFHTLVMTEKVCKLLTRAVLLRRSTVWPLWLLSGQ